MAISPYFPNYTFANTQGIITELVKTVIQHKGFDINYLCRENINYDEILGEADQYSFVNNFIIECYMQNSENWGSLGESMGVFGWQIKDQATLVFSKERFMTELEGYRTMPRNGDVIYVPFSQSFLQIKQFDYDRNFWEHGVNPTYTVDCELWAYSGEEVDSGNNAIQTELAKYPVSNSIIFIPDDNTELDIEKDIYIDFTEYNPYLIL